MQRGLGRGVTGHTRITQQLHAHSSTLTCVLQSLLPPYHHRPGQRTDQLRGRDATSQARCAGEGVGSTPELLSGWGPQASSDAQCSWQHRQQPIAPLQAACAGAERSPRVCHSSDVQQQLGLARSIQHPAARIRQQTAIGLACRGAQSRGSCLATPTNSGTRVSRLAASSLPLPATPHTARKACPC